MQISYDRAADAAYVYVVDPIQEGEAVEQHELDLPLGKATIILDFDSDRRLLGVEVLGASEVLRPDLLRAAEQI